MQPSLASCGKLECEFIRAGVAINKDKAEDIRVEFEKSFVRQLNREWVPLAKKALKAGTTAWSGANTKAQVSKIVGAVSRVIDGFGSGSEQFIEESIATVYEGLTEQFLRENKLEKAAGGGTGAKFAATFTQRDKDAIAAIQKITKQSAGILFPEEIINKVQTVVEDVVLNEGLSPEAAAVRLEEEVSGALGLMDATQSVVPVAFSTNPEAYFEVLAQNASVLSTNIGRVTAMSEAGVKEYEVVAVIDQRTSKICQGMNGRKIPVASGVRMIDAILGFAGPAELKDSFPWDSTRTAKDLGPDTLANNADLAKGGLGFPPYHGRCRSTVIPVL